MNLDDAPPRFHAYTKHQIDPARAALVVDPVRAYELADHHERDESGKVTVYAFVVYRRDRLRAVHHKVTALQARFIAAFGQSERDAARVMAEVAGRRRLIDDELGLREVLPGGGS